MGCRARIVAQGARGAGDGAVDAAVDAAVGRLRVLEARWSRFLTTSEVSRVNAARGAPVVVSPDTVALFAHALVATELTGGRFDPLLHDELVALGYDRSHELLTTGGGRPRAPRPDPRPHPIDGITIDVDNGVVMLAAGAAFDPGGIGKGLAADLVATELRAWGCDAALVDLGGDIRADGTPPEGGWTIAVEDPSAPARAIATVALAGGGIATSNRLRRSWEHDGHRVHHLLDPATGGPAVTDLVAVTVLAASAWWAEVAAKAALIAGSREGKRWLLAQGLPALLVDGSFVAERVGGFEAYEAAAP